MRCRVSDRGCLYALIDPRPNGVEFYFGIGKERRPWGHFKGINGNRFRWNKIQKLRRAGIADRDMIVILARDRPADELRYLEETHIKFFGRRSTGEGPLTNLTPGGERNPMDDPVTRKKLVATLRTPEWQAKNAAHISAINADLEYREKRNAQLRALHADPVLAAKRNAQLRALHADPVWAAKHAARSRSPANLARLRANSADPEFRAANAARGAVSMRALHADPVFAAKNAARAKLPANLARLRALNADPKHLAQLRTLNADPEFQAKRIAALRASAFRRRAKKLGIPQWILRAREARGE